jgi:hypothetical protein
MYSGQSGTGRIFWSTFVSFCQCHSASAPYSSASTRCSYQKDKLGDPGNLAEEMLFFGNLGALDTKQLALSLPLACVLG